MAYYKKVVFAVKCVALLLLLLLLLLHLAPYHVPLPALYDRVLFSHRPTLTSPPHFTNFTGLKKILYWNDYYGKKDFNVGVGREPFVDKGCLVDTCYATYDRDLFPIMEVDAVIWHAFSGNRTLPTQRSLHTRYVFFLMESPSRHNVNLTLYKDVFNYTISYRRDSDIRRLYGEFERRETPLEDDNLNYAVGKTKMAVWFVSNCHAPSARRLLTKKLQEYVSVDIYGKCGTFSCPKSDMENCLSMISKEYRFYLSFENSLCKDYVTEKFFQITRYNMIPVVYGLPDYSAIAPTHSFINVLDFKTVKHLADYLTFLSHNDTAYNEYFRWRKNFKRKGGTPWCDLCAKLHSDKKVKTYDIYNWYDENKCVNFTTLSLKF